MEIYWEPGWEFDRHVIRITPDEMQDHNRLCPLDQFVRVIESDGSKYRLSERPVTTCITAVNFMPQFKGAPDALGVWVDTNTGHVEAWTEDQPPPKLRNFLIEVKIQHNDPILVSPVFLSIRVHVHNTINKVWLSPDPLTVHQGTVSSRLTVLAKFDDGVVGEITDWARGDGRDLRRRSPHPPQNLKLRLWWNSKKQNINLMPSIDGSISCNMANLSDTFFVTYSPRDRATVHAQAFVKSVEPWTEPTEVQWIAGPGTDKRDNVPNILLLSEGFEESDQDRNLFKTLVTQIATAIKSITKLSPFNHLVDSFNFWMAFVPSPHAGVNVLSEVACLRENGESVRVSAVPVPEPFPDHPSPYGSNEWTLERLIYKVGLPVMDDKGKSLQEKSDDWKILYNFEVTKDQINDNHINSIFNQWMLLHDRTLVFEHDSAFGIAMGGRLSDPCHGYSDSHIGFNKKRLQDSEFYEFLTGLAYNNNPIGYLWIESYKNLNIACFIAKSNHFAGTYTISTVDSGHSIYILKLALTLDEDSEFNVKYDGDKNLSIANDKISEYLTPFFVGTFAHELSHFFGLDDEYAGQHIERCGETSLKNYLPEQIRGNVQLREQLISTDPQRLVGDKIKWRWPRIRKTGVLQKQPEGPSVLGNYTITLGIGHQLQWHGSGPMFFEKGDVLCLMHRRLSERTASDCNCIVSVSEILLPCPDGDVLEVEPIKGDPRNYSAGSLLTQPVFDESGRKMLELVAEAIREHINAEGGPLNAPSIKQATRDCQQSYDSDPIKHLASLNQATNLPASLSKKPDFDAKIVGLYEGGMGYPCGVYHPTGICNMQGGGGEIVSFCPVCRYLLVDRIDPTKHADIDAEYDEEYPK